MHMSANNVFVSYKYYDSDVKSLGNGISTVRDYVNCVERLFDKSEKVYYCGERDGDDQSDFSEDIIRRHLSDKIFYTTVTVVLISPNMYDRSRPENMQWIPWEISYSLKETRRESGKSHMNAVLAVVLPDRNGKYDYAVEQCGCHRVIHKERFFSGHSKEHVQCQRTRDVCLRMRAPDVLRHLQLHSFGDMGGFHQGSRRIHTESVG